MEYWWLVDEHFQEQEFLPSSLQSFGSSHSTQQLETKSTEEVYMIILNKNTYFLCPFKLLKDKDVWYMNNNESISLVRTCWWKLPWTVRFFSWLWHHEPIFFAELRANSQVAEKRSKVRENVAGGGGLESPLVLQKVPSEANPKVRNHREGPY